MDFAGFPSAGNAVVEIDRSMYTMLAPEAQRYAAFFATLEQPTPGLAPRRAAIAFFNKSALSEADVETLYASVKSVGVQPDANAVNETEFVLAMHMIVCLTKRGLAALPQPFPTYLFPTLALPTAGSHDHADLISSMPSPEKPSTGGGLGETSSAFSRGSFTGAAGGGADAGSMPTTVPSELVKLDVSTSLVELTQKEIQNNQVVKSQLAQIDQSEAKTLEHLQATLTALASAVDQLGFAVPSATYASIGAVDDLGNLLRANVQSIKQEVQSLEISARMRSVADEASSRSNSLSSSIPGPSSASEPGAAVAEVAKLSAQLAALQHEATQLQTKKDSLARQLLDKKTARTLPPVGIAMPSVPTKTVSDAFMSAPLPPSSSTSTSSLRLAASSSWGDFGAAPAAVAPLAPLSDSVRSTESTTPAPSDAFGFGAFETTSTPASTGAAQPQDADFGWGAFQ